MNSSEVARSGIGVLNASAATTVVGSFPGTDTWEATAVIRGELPDVPTLPELPGRGPGADMIGRTMSMLAGVSSEFAVTTTPTGWRLAGHRGSTLPAVMRLASSWLGEDLDAAESAFSDFTGCYKIQLAGPWTLAACVELPIGDVLLRDSGAVAELHGALAEALIAQIRQVGRRLPRAKLFVQFDEPMLDRVLEGSITTPSGFSAYQPVPGPLAAAAIRKLTGAASSAGAISGVHTCAARPELEVLRVGEADFVSCDLTQLVSQREDIRARNDEEIGQLFDANRLLFAGLKAEGLQRTDPRRTLAPLVSTLGRLGIPAETVLKQLVLTPTCGLASAGSLANVRAVISELNAAGRALRDERADEARADR